MDIADSGRDRDNKVLAKKRETNVKKKLESRVVTVQKMCIGDINAGTWGGSAKRKTRIKGGKLHQRTFN